MDTSSSLNYFADPDAEALEARLRGGHWEPIDLPGQWPDKAPVKINVTGSDKAEVVRPKMGQTTWNVALPLGESATLEVRAHGEFEAPPGTLEIEMIHATTAPREKPKWRSLSAFPEREENETSQGFVAEFDGHQPSSGETTFALYWNEYWDERV